MPQISIVIPVYNAEKYLGECIESVLNQTFGDFEFIMVDDCSTDGSVGIIERYMKSDPRIRLIKRKENSGSAYLPGKEGVLKAGCENIVTMGDDDWLDADYFEKLINRKHETGAEIIFGVMDFEPNMYRITPPHCVENQVITGEEACMLTVPKWQIGTNGGLVDRSLLLKVWDKYPADPSLTRSDELQGRQMMLMAKTVAFADCVYHYRIHMQSITRAFNIKRFDTVITDALLRELLEQHFGPKSPEAGKGNVYCFYGLKHSIELYEQNKAALTPSQRIEVRAIIKKYYDRLDVALMRPFVSTKIYILAHLPVSWLYPILRWSEKLKRYLTH